MDPEAIRKLWRNPQFSGSFAGLANFKAALKFEKNIDISTEKLFQILKQDRNYILEMRKVKKVTKRRPMNIHGYGVLFQTDVGQMFPEGDYSAFLLCIDIFSRRIFCQKLKSKTAVEVERAFQKIFQDAGIKPEKIESDQGGEFKNSRNFFVKNNIFWKLKIGANKAR